MDAVLPKSARKHKIWWLNSPRYSQAGSWLSAGWMAVHIDLASETVIFERCEQIISNNKEARGQATQEAMISNRKSSKSLLVRDMAIRVNDDFVRADIKQLRLEIKADIKKLRHKMRVDNQVLRNSIIKWIVSFSLIIMAFIIILHI